MKKINLGRVLPVFRGEYSATDIYTKLDIVSYNGSSYVAKQTVTGITPTDATAGAANWLLVAQAGQVAWPDLTPEQKAQIYQDIIDSVFGDYNDRLTLTHGSNTVTFFDNGNITTKKHNLDTIAANIQTNAEAITTKANAADVYDKTEINAKVASLHDENASTYNYAKDNIEDLADDIAAVESTVAGKADASSVYDKDTVDTKVGTVATAVSTLAGNVYTKSQINSTVSGINQDIDTLQNTTYTRTYLDTQLGGKADVENIYTKSQLDFMMQDKIVTPDYYADFATLLRNALYDIREACSLDEYFRPLDNTTLVEGSTLSISITANEIQNHIYNCTTPLASLTLESVAASRYETDIYFTSGTTATTLTYPNTLKWLSSDTIAANTSYVLSVKFNRAELKAETTN